MIRIVLVDDHAVMREGLKQLFAAVGGIEVVAEATDGDSVLDSLRGHSVDLVLVDMAIWGVCDENLVARIRASHPKLPILAMSVHNEPQIARRVIQAGANGYVTKDQEAEIMLAAIRDVAGGGCFIDPLLAGQVVFDRFKQVLEERRDSMVEPQPGIFPLA